MLLNTRRRMLGLLAAAIGTTRLVQFVPRAFAAKTPECFALQPFGEWKGVATNTQAGARIGQVTFANPDTCDLRAEIQVAESYDIKLVVYGDPEGTRLPKTLLIRTDNRLIIKNEDGTTAIDEPLCGVCTDIRDDKVSIVLPLATGALLRTARSVEMAVKLGGTKECRFTLNCEDLREALDWATQQKATLAPSFEAQKCTPPSQGCFITTACCEVLDLDDDCFELRTLRHYRDQVLTTTSGGHAAIAAYSLLAPSILEGLPQEERVTQLLSVYARFILPSAIAARFGFNRLTYRFYARMMHELAREFAPDERRTLPADNPSSHVVCTVARRPRVKS